MGGHAAQRIDIEDIARASSRIPGFYKMSQAERLGTLIERGIIDAADAEHLMNCGAVGFDVPNNMIENAIGVLEMPLGLGLNFSVNGKDYIVPMAVEEPSVVAAVSHIAKIARGSDGFRAEYSGSIMVGQIQVVGCEDFDVAKTAVLDHRQELIDAANAYEPGMVERGGGAKDIRVRVLDQGKYRKMMVVHLVVDTCDAMGANMINTMAEGIADRVEELTAGRVFLRILSNLCDERIAVSEVSIPFADLAWRGFSGEEVAEGIELASQFAEVDPYRATTHNKGIMNGISSMCIATGNDWRAIEAGCHAYAARSGQYSPMAVWWTEDGHLRGRIEVPLALGTVGGPIRLHPTIKLAHKILNISGVKELAEVMASVGLAQNMAALKALATEGIQRGHMSLHARSVAATAGATDDELDEAVRLLIASGDIKVEKAREVLMRMRSGLG